MNDNNVIDIKENISKGKTIRTHCNKCGQDMNHQILMDYCENGTVVLDSDCDLKYEKIDYTADFSNDYQIVKCAGCNTISYRNYNCFSAYQGIDDNGTREERFPAPQKRTGRCFNFLPSSLTRIYLEVITTYNNNGFILCAAGIRAILEGVCKEKGIEGNNLKQKIIKMYEQELITQAHKSILHKLRFLGNTALHKLQMPTHEEIEAALDIIEHIVEGLYEIVGKAEILKANAGGD
jgi:hypothetical protein